jgi:8-oxo-dGTP diphosphatase
MIDVVAGIIKNKEGKILIARRNLTKAQGGLWEFPGGKIEPNETKEDAIVREIKEEFGLDIEIISYLGKVEDDEKIGYIYSARKLYGNLALGGEELEANSTNNYYEIRKVSIDEIDNIELLPENKELIKKAARALYLIK